ncbi:MAG: acetyl-CoA carboxylase, carboxyltransferase subunit beta [Planctomycetia bacterium]|nr:acetyl-CoA carboxylase, carboxyltransferase subunit beta [Planctomycetia bacterium]
MGEGVRSVSVELTMTESGETEKTSARSGNFSGATERTGGSETASPVTKEGGGGNGSRDADAARIGSRVPEGLWIRCPGCHQMIFREEAERRYSTCPECDYHWSISASRRVGQLIDPGTFEEWDAGMISTDPLGFVDRIPYGERLVRERARTHLKDAVVTGCGMIRARRVVFGLTDSGFMMGSMGSVVGEKLCRAIERADAERLPLVIVCGSGGGARMQEGLISLMQMAKTSAALARYSANGGLYISVLTNPTMGGTAASFASLGDLIFAEPRALIGFAGPRTIQATIRTELPRGFQTSEFLLEHGYLDRIVRRPDLKSEIARAIDYCGK